MVEPIRPDLEPKFWVWHNERTRSVTGGWLMGVPMPKDFTIQPGWWCIYEDDTGLSAMPLPPRPDREPAA